MSFSIPELVKKVSGKSDLLSSILGWVRSDFKWSLLIIPILFSVLIYTLSEVDFQGWGDRHRFKSLMEIVHPVILATFLLVSLQSWFSTKDTTFAFLHRIKCTCVRARTHRPGCRVCILSCVNWTHCLWEQNTRIGSHRCYDQDGLRRFLECAFCVIWALNFSIAVS